MTGNMALAGLVLMASKRHNDASGRRLAEIAAADGYEVSHSTLNRIRRGTYEAVPSVATLRAIAHLASVSEDKVFESAAQKITDEVEIEAAFVEWLNAKYRLENLASQYARLRAITPSSAAEELRDLELMFADSKAADRPWTPPWNPGPQFTASETPWKRDWWSASDEVDTARRTHVFNWDLDRVRARQNSAGADTVGESLEPRSTVEDADEGELELTIVAARLAEMSEDNRRVIEPIIDKIQRWENRDMES